MPFLMPGRALRRTPLTVVAVALALLTAPVLWGAGAAPPPPQDPGSLVQTSMQSEVGVVLDELPTPMRARVASALRRRLRASHPSMPEPMGGQAA